MGGYTWLPVALGRITPPLLTRRRAWMPVGLNGNTPSSSEPVLLRLVPHGRYPEQSGRRECSPTRTADPTRADEGGGGRNDHFFERSVVVKRDQ